MKNRWLIFIALLFVISSVSAEILVSQPKGVYNLGDEFLIDISVTQVNSKTGFLISKVSCPNGEIEIYKAPLSVKPGEKKQSTVSTLLDKSVIGELTGNCKIIISFSEETRESQEFEISNEVKIDVGNIGFLFNPGDEIKLSGTAVKKNGQDLEGFVNSKISGTQISSGNEVESGKFNLNFSIPENAKAGLFSLDIEVYDKDSNGQVINTGKSSINIKINQIAREIDVAISPANIIPGNSLDYNVIVYDQAGDLMSGEAVISMYNSNNNKIREDLVSINNLHKFDINSTHLPGHWSIEAKFGGITNKKTFLVESFESVSYSLSNGTLMAVNTGNVPYNKDVKFILGDSSFIKEINLRVGEAREYELSVPAGEHLLEFDDGTGIKSIGSVIGNNARISGLAIGDIGEDLSLNISTIIWILAILILISLAVYYYKRIRKNKFYGSPSKASLKPISKNSSGIIDSGEKQESAVVSVKIKNYSEIRESASNAPDTVNNIRSLAESFKGHFIDSGEYKSIVLAQALTGKTDNSLNAVKLAKKIEDLLNEHNKKYSQKIQFGIGINIGLLIIEKTDGRPKIVSLGNTIPISRRIAEYSSNDILISEEVHKKTLGIVKGDRTKDNYWKIRRIVERGESNNKFITDFKRRQGSN